MLTILLALAQSLWSGSSSGVERKLPKLDVAGSTPVSRSNNSSSARILQPTRSAAFSLLPGVLS